MQATTTVPTTGFLGSTALRYYGRFLKREEGKSIELDDERRAMGLIVSFVHRTEDRHPQPIKLYSYEAVREYYDSVMSFLAGHEDWPAINLCLRPLMKSVAGYNHKGDPLKVMRVILEQKMRVEPKTPDWLP